jgi:hypothetical protein
LFQPSKDFKVDCYVAAYFAGLYEVKDVHDPICAKSHTGYVMTIANCPLMWVSKLQTEISLSTQNSEYVALSTLYRDLLPIKNLVHELMGILDVTKQGLTYTEKSACFEDNAAYISLATLRKITSQNRHIATKYHWFHEHIQAGTLDIKKISSKQQKADIFTKNLTPEKFAAACYLLCGW